VKIARLTPADVDEVAALHGASLRGLLTRLGPSATRAYYAGAAKSPFALGYVARGNHGLEGFVLGSIEPAELRRDVVGREPVRILAGVAAGLLRRPGNLRWLLKSFGSPDAGYYDATCAELIYLAVSPARRGRGVGRDLVGKFSDAMHDAGQTRFELSVDADNPDAVRFYERLGFTKVGDYEEFGQRHVRYRRTFAASA
jgi:ribosomal protein S18 acetylase RimI-like enzyme